MTQCRAPSLLSRIPTWGWVAVVVLALLAIAAVPLIGEYRRHTALVGLERLGYTAGSASLSRHTDVVLESRWPAPLASRIPEEARRTWLFRVQALCLLGGDAASRSAERTALRAFPEVTAVVFYRDTDREDFQALAAATRLKHLEFATNRAEEHLNGLATLSPVQSIDLVGNYVSPASLREIGKCRGVERLFLRGNLNRAVLQEVGRLSQIRTLTLIPVNPKRDDPPPFTASHIAELRNLSACQDLDLGIVDFGAVGALPDLPALRTLTVSGNVAIEELARLKASRTLTRVSIESRTLFESCLTGTASGVLGKATKFTGHVRQVVRYELKADDGHPMALIVARDRIRE